MASTTITITRTDDTGHNLVLDALPVLSNGTATFGVKRLDNNEVVVPAGTEMTANVDGSYSYTFEDPAGGLSYLYSVQTELGGDTTWQGGIQPSATPASVAASGVYADQTDVQDLIGSDNLTVIGDLDDDGNLDTGIVQRALDFADAYINLELSRNGLTTPADLTDADRAAVLRDVAAHLAVWHLWHHRGLQPLQSGGRDGIAGVFEGYKRYADEQLAKLVAVLSAADGDPATEPGGFAFVPTTRRRCRDENAGECE